MKKAFTLIELLVSITILSIMMLFLYRTYAMTNFSNTIFKDESKKIIDIQKIKKVIYLDFAFASSVTIKVEEKNEDLVKLQSSNSIHQRFNPYITYTVKNKKLYRLESLKDSQFDIDYLGEIQRFKVYKSSDKNSNIFLVNIEFKNQQQILLKINNSNKGQ